jgi:hypothetical protein
MVGSAFAGPVVLKCVSSDGQPVADLTIDFGKKELRWGGVVIYDIINITDRYISAYERTGNRVGGEIWVIDRLSGDYKRGSVGIFSNVKPASPERFDAFIFSGRCVKQQF